MKWPPQAQEFSIAVKELFPEVIAAGIYGKYWSGLLVPFSADNAAVVLVFQATYSQESHLMHLIRTLVFVASHFKLWFTTSHIPGFSNALADILSRNNEDLLLSQVCYAQQQPSSIPSPLIDLLVCNITCMDIHSLDKAVQGYFVAALAPATHKTYKVAECRDVAFCMWKLYTYSLSSIGRYPLLLCTM